MRRRVHAVGWGLFALAVVALAAIIVVGTVRANGAAAFNRWVGWATVAALPVAVAGLVLMAWDKVTKTNLVPQVDIAGSEDRLAAVVLAQQAWAVGRSRA